MIPAGDYERVQTQVSEVKRMLAGLLLKLTALKAAKNFEYFWLALLRVGVPTGAMMAS
jgi:hypothetical protein